MAEVEATLLAGGLGVGRVWAEEELGARREENAILKAMDELLVMEDERLVEAAR